MRSRFTSALRAHVRVLVCTISCVRMRVLANDAKLLVSGTVNLTSIYSIISGIGLIGFS